MIGNIGGKLKTGRYIDFPGYGQVDHRTTANFYTTLLQLTGSSRESFGVEDPTLRKFGLDQHGPLQTLFA